MPAPAVSDPVIAPQPEPAPGPVKAGPGFGEFVAMVAGLMALGALGTDSMLPALPAMGRSFAVDNTNHLQWIISAYFLGNGAGQLIFGSVSDWLGRKRVLLCGVVLYILFSLLCACAPSLIALIVLRVLQGMAASASNVVTRSIVRDLYNGSKMAKVMSLSYMIFLLVPILAPSIGQVILLALPWQAIFLALALFGVGIATWVSLRLPETHAEDKRKRPDLNHLRRVTEYVFTEPTSIFYTLGVMCLFSSLLSYVSLMPQIFSEVFHKPALMAPVFAGVAATMGCGALLNSQLVERLGSRRISHIALTIFVCISLIHLIWAWLGYETVISFVAFQALTLGSASLTTSNFASIAMEKVGHVAGTASSIQGVTTVVGGALMGTFIGQHWHGDITLLPLSACGCAIAALSLVAIGEKGRLYRRIGEA